MSTIFEHVFAKLFEPIDHSSCSLLSQFDVLFIFAVGYDGGWSLELSVDLTHLRLDGVDALGNQHFLRHYPTRHLAATEVIKTQITMRRNDWFGGADEWTDDQQGNDVMWKVKVVDGRMGALRTALCVLWSPAIKQAEIWRTKKQILKLSLGNKNGCWYWCKTMHVDFNGWSNGSLRSNLFILKVKKS